MEIYSGILLVLLTVLFLNILLLTFDSKAYISLGDSNVYSNYLYSAKSQHESSEFVLIVEIAHNTLKQLDTGIFKRLELEACGCVGTAFV